MADPRPPATSNRCSIASSKSARTTSGSSRRSSADFHGRGEADAYSDVDLCVIAKVDAYETLAGDRLGFVGRLGTPLFFEDFWFASLVFFVLGVLALGPKESLAFTPHADQYEVLDLQEKLYRKVR